MNEFKAGDLAIIIHCDDPYNLGKQVELVQFVENREVYESPTGLTVINTSGTHVWVCAGDVEIVRGDETVHGFTQKIPRNLMPLKGEFAPVKEKQEEQPA